MNKLGQLFKDPGVAKKRATAFAWELGNMVLVATLAFAANNLELLNISPAVVAVLALVLNQVTKQLNSK